MNRKSVFKFWIEGPCDGDIIVWRDYIGGEPMCFKQPKRCAEVALSIEGGWQIVGVIENYGGFHRFSSDEYSGFEVNELAEAIRAEMRDSLEGRL